MIALDPTKRQITVLDLMDFVYKVHSKNCHKIDDQETQLPKTVAFAVALVKSYANATVRRVGFVVAFVSYSKSSES